jgi:YVTN family beta-propeller protein
MILLDIGTIGTIGLIKPAFALTGIQTDGYPSSIAVDSTMHKIYVANQRSNTVSVIGLDSGKVMNRINTSALPVSLAISPAYGAVYVTNAKANTVSVIDLLTNKIVDNIKVGSYPYSLAIEGDSLYVANPGPSGENKTISVIQLENDQVKSFQVGISPEAVAAGRTIYVADGSHTVMALTGRKNITGFDQPTALAADPVKNKIYVANHVDNVNHTISVIDGNTLKKGPNIILNDPNAAPRYITVYPPDGKKYLVYVANPVSNTVSIINGTTDKELVGITFNINPPTTGSIYCNGRKISQTDYVNYEIGRNLHCQAEANVGFTFNSWSGSLASTSNQNSTTLTFNPSNRGDLTANFRVAPPALSIPPDFFYGFISAVILGPIVGGVIGWLLPFVKRPKET